MSYKYQRVRERLRQAISDGELSGKLPGERELSRQYGANPKTINKALTDLAIEGLLVRHVGRGTFVSDGSGRSKADNRPSRALQLGYLIPAEGLRACAEDLYRRTAGIVAALGHKLEQLVVAVEPSGELSGQRLSADRLRSFDGIALFSARPSAALLASTSREHLPLVMVNNQHEQVRTAAVLVDYAQGAFELCRHLIQLGHARIRLCFDPATLPAARAAEAGYRAAMQSYSLKPQPAYEPEQTFNAQAALAGIDSEPPSAMICTGSAMLAALKQAALSEAGQPISLTCIPEPCEDHARDADITSYEVDPDHVARWIAELLISASPTRWQRVVIVPGGIAHRGSSRTAASGANVARSPDAAIV